MRKTQLPKPSVSDGPKFYSVAQVARMLGMSPMTLYRAISDGEFPAVRIRSRLIVPAQVLHAISDAAMTTGGVVDAADWVPETGNPVVA